MALAGSERDGTRVRDAVVLAAMSLACLWRRRKPLWFLIAVVALVFPLSLKPPSSGGVGGWGGGLGCGERFRGNVGASVRCQWAFWGARAVAEGVE